ncbi:MAG: ferredoxin [Candidatus Methanofastidiosia archaeon]
MARYKVELDKEECIGCGACENICPELFALKSDVAEVLEEEINDPACAKEACEMCPVECIKVKKIK